MYAKRNKTLKALVAVLSMVLVMCLTVAGTLAWLVDETTPVVNTFSPSNIDLKLEENATEGGTTKANTYKMIPGVEIAKDPKVTVTADIDSYVFVKVEETANFDTYMTYAIANGWKLLANNTVTDIAANTDLDGTYVLFREVSATADEDQDSKNDVEAFYVLDGNQVMVPNTVTKGDMDKLYTNDGTVKADAELPKLTFTAYAIQKQGFEHNLTGAWTQAQAQG